MRIISGSAKGRKLATFGGRAIRPTSDRVREALFSMLLNRLGTFVGKTVLDLYAGTGALGIEALSRGAQQCVFVDQAGESIALIRKNLNHVGLADCAQVVIGRVEDRVRRLPREGFDLIFIDPPYAAPNIDSVLSQVAEAGLLGVAGILCLETSTSSALPEQAGPLQRCDQRRYGTTMLSLYARIEQKESCV